MTMRMRLFAPRGRDLCFVLQTKIPQLSNATMYQHHPFIVGDLIYSSASYLIQKRLPLIQRSKSLLGLKNPHQPRVTKMPSSL